MDFSLIIPSFIAGMLTFLAPCTLPLVPAYLGFISGTSANELKDTEKAKKAKKKIFLNGLFFILGFSVIFVVFGALAGLVGSALIFYRIWLTRIGGAFVIIFGLFMTGLFRLPFLDIEKRFRAPSSLKVGNPLSSFILGSTFAFGWTPCVGPILGSILLLASTSTTALQGGFLLAVFSLGLAAPFLLVALGLGVASSYIKKISKYLHIVSIIGGILLVLLGILLMTNNFSLLIQYGFRFLQFLNYDAILDHL